MIRRASKSSSAPGGRTARPAKHSTASLARSSKSAANSKGNSRTLPLREVHEGAPWAEQLRDGAQPVTLSMIKKLKGEFVGSGVAGQLYWFPDWSILLLAAGGIGAAVMTQGVFERAKV